MLKVFLFNSFFLKMCLCKIFLLCKVEKKGEFTLRKCIIAERKPDKEICEDLIKIDRKLSQLLGQTDFECKVCDTDYCNA